MAMSKQITQIFALATALAMAGTQRALACSVCFSAKNEANQIAYLATTAFLTFLPLLFAAGVMVWIRRRAQALNVSEGEQLANGTVLPLPVKHDR